MYQMRQWLFKTVAAEINSKGFGGVSLKLMRQSSKLSRAKFRQRFPNKQKLFEALVDEIAEAHREFFKESIEGTDDPRERLIIFFTSSSQFIDRHLSLGHVIVRGLIGTRIDTKEHIYLAYEPLHQSIMTDLHSAGIVDKSSRLLLSDLAEILFIVIFFGGCPPKITMEYLSYTNPRMVGQSVLEGLRRRYSDDGLHGESPALVRVLP
jgi:AcrR family transcriptional regulator